MQIRILAGWKRLSVALAIASLVVAPVGAAANGSKGKQSNVASSATNGGLRHVEDNPRGDKEPVLYQRSNYAWPFSSGPNYGTVDAVGWKAASVVHTQVGSFDLSRGMPALPNELRTTNRLGELPAQYFLMQIKPESFTNGSFDDMKRTIAAAGGSVVAEVPVAAFIVRLTPSAHSALRSSGSVVALEPYHPAFKLSPVIGRVPLLDAAKAVSNVYSLELRLFPGEALEPVVAALTAMGAHVVSSGGDKIAVDVDRSKLAAIAGIEAVYTVNEVLPILAMNEEDATVVQTGRWNNGATPYTDAGIDGGGLNKGIDAPGLADDQLLMVLDTGIQLDAGDLSDTRSSAGTAGATHRKVLFYGTTNAFAPLGAGDLLGCDSNTTSGFTHGHAVAAIALGNASKVLTSYGGLCSITRTTTCTQNSDCPVSETCIPNGFRATDLGGNFWGLDGVAPRARLIAYDAQVTPLTGRCDDPQQGNITPGDLYTAPLGGSLGDGYSKGARVINFSWGVANTPGIYESNAQDVDQFLADHSDAMVFIASGNTGRDLDRNNIPDPNTIGPPATSKNAIVVGASATADDLGTPDPTNAADFGGDPDAPNSRALRSSNGPATPASNRIAPLLMAPGIDIGTTGVGSPYICRTNDNDQTIPVECDVITGIAGLVPTSWAAANASGAALLVRDYFAQGFYPDGTIANPGNNGAWPAGNQISTISGDLLKALLVASADWMNQPGNVTIQTPTNAPWGYQVPDYYNNTGGLTRTFRGNREQGFGRIQLSNLLPIQSAPGTPSGLIVDDGGAAPAGIVHSTTLNTKIDPGKDSRTCSNSTSTSCNVDGDCPAGGTCVPYSFNVCDTSQNLTVVIAWTDPSNASDILTRHLALQLTSPSGRVYWGNFFDDDKNDSLALDAGEDVTYSAGCPWPSPATASAAGTIDTGPWSLPAASGGACTVGGFTLANHLDTNNNVQAIFLSSDSFLNGVNNDTSTASTDEAADNQIEQGVWKVVVADPNFLDNVNFPVANSGAQTYSIAIVGGICQGSSARVSKVLSNNQLVGTSLACNDSAVVTIDEIGTPGNDPVSGLTPTTIAARTKVQVLDSTGAVVDQEQLGAGDVTLVSSNGNNVRFDSRKILLTDATAPDPGNGVLDVRDGQTVRVVYQDQSPTGTNDPNGLRTGSAKVNCKASIATGGVVFPIVGRDAFSLVNGGCEKDKRGYFTFGYPDRYMDPGELVSYTVAFQSAELGTKLTNLSVSLRAVTADSDSPANCAAGSVGICADPNRTNNVASPYLTVLDSPKLYSSLPPTRVLSPTFTIQMSSSPAFSAAGPQKVDMLIGLSSKSAGKTTDGLIAKREILNADEESTYYSTDFPTGGTEASGGFDLNNNETLEDSPTTDPQFFRSDIAGYSDYQFEKITYGDMTATGHNSTTSVQGPWNFDTCARGGKGAGTPMFCSQAAADGFQVGLQNTSRKEPGMPLPAQWGEDLNFNGKLDGYCSGALTSPCTKGDVESQNCNRCSGNIGKACGFGTLCNQPGDGTCTAYGTCNYAAGEDRSPANGELDYNWNTTGGCGWQTNTTGGSTGGAWHTGAIRATGSQCLAEDPDTDTKCNAYKQLIDGDLAGDNEWWELLETPVLHKVNQGLDGSGDPLYQVQITDWSWNMLMDIPDANTALRWAFDNDLNKIQGVDLYNSAGGGTLGLLGLGVQGSLSGGNAPLSRGFSMFAQISHCLDTDGNGSPDHCGTAAGSLCGSDPNNIDLECTGADTKIDRGVCDNPPAQKRCTSNLAICSADTDCPTDERCVTNYLVCQTNADCTGGGNCVHTSTGTNRVGKNSCWFEGKKASGLAKAQEPYGLPTPSDDDVVNGYCKRNDTLTGTDKSKSCTISLGTAPGFCSNARTVACATNADCTNVTSTCVSGKCSNRPLSTCTVNADCPTTTGICAAYDSCWVQAGPYTTCDTTLRTASSVDQYVQMNGPGRNMTIKDDNGPSMVVNTLEDFFGDTGKDFRAAIEWYTREPTANTPSVPNGFGVAVDDMVISWKETTVVADQKICSLNQNKECDGDGVGPRLCSGGDGTCVTHCAASGICADLETSTGIGYDGNSIVNVTVTDSTPYDATNPKNDCNGDNDYTDAVKHCWKPFATTGSDVACPSTALGAPCTGIVGALSGELCFGPDSTDCNGNGTPDVTVKLTTESPGETTGEQVVCDRKTNFCTGNQAKTCAVNADCNLPTDGTCYTGTNVYKAAFPYSTFYDSPGTLFVVQSGTQPPTIRAFYTDRNDGTGNMCKNQTDPTKQGKIENDLRVVFNTGRVTVNSYKLNLVSTCSLNAAKTCTTNADCLAGEGTCFTCSILTSKPCDPQATALPATGFCTPAQGTCITTTPNRGDPDAFADTNETIAMSVEFSNKAGVDLDDLAATLGTNSPNIECISRSSTLVGALANGALSKPKVCSLLTTKGCVQDADCTAGQGVCNFNYQPFVFKVANINRTNVNQILQTDFTLTMRSNKFDSLQRATDILLDLDLNATGTPAPTSFTESFESPANFDKFTLDTLDFNKNSVPKSYGMRCQINDPFGLNSYSTGNEDCFLGFPTDVGSLNDWHVHTASTGGLARAFKGTQSMHWGVHQDNNPGHDTYHFKQLDALRMADPIALPFASSNPELNFAMQIGFPDSVQTNVTAGESTDRAVVQVQLADSAGQAVGNWIKIQPFQNVYDEQGTDDFSNCTFDPTDDGNDEKSFFDYTDPNRQHGPSSTCYPEFCFIRQGQTDYRAAFSPTDINNASDGPGLQGSTGPGTWVRPRFSLSAFGARRIRVRFLVSTIEIFETQLAVSFFGNRPDLPYDDGWYIDDINVNPTVSVPLTISVDSASTTGIACSSCSALTAALVATPSTGLTSPGQVVTLDAKTSSVTSCINGVLQYQFWSVDGDNTVGNGTDALLRDWTDSSSYLDAPTATTRYGVKIRCSTSPTCTGTDSAITSVNVGCPTGGTVGAATIKVNKVSGQNVNIVWATSTSVDAVMGDLCSSSTGTTFGGATVLLKPKLTDPPPASPPLSTFTGTVIAPCLATNSAAITNLNEGLVLTAGQGVYYLVRANNVTYCNQGPNYATQNAKERVGRDAQLATDPVSCP